MLFGRVRKVQQLRQILGLSQFWCIQLGTVAVQQLFPFVPCAILFFSFVQPFVTILPPSIASHLQVMQSQIQPCSFQLSPAKQKAHETRVLNVSKMVVQELCALVEPVTNEQVCATLIHMQHSHRFSCQVLYDVFWTLHDSPEQFASQDIWVARFEKLTKNIPACNAFLGNLRESLAAVKTRPRRKAKAPGCESTVFRSRPMLP